MAFDAAFMLLCQSSCGRGACVSGAPHNILWEGPRAIGILVLWG